MMETGIDGQSRRLKNARIVLEISGNLKKGETVVILADRKKKCMSMNKPEALAAVAVEMEAYPVIVDITEYARLQSYKDCEGFVSVKAALKAADVVIGNSSDFKHVGCGGVLQSFDVFLTGKQRWMDLQKGMEIWDITGDEVAEITKRTKWLYEKMDSVREIRVTSPAGTDFVCEPLKSTPILGIIPNYGEIAIVPKPGSGEGVVVIDGTTQRSVRTKEEIDREPLRINVKAGEVQDYSGDPEQIKRLEQFINSGTPPGRYIDEVGIPTTRVKANDMCWTDGTHGNETIHIALGNNQLRDDLIHGPLHMDGEIIKPSVFFDGKIIVKDSVFVN